MILNREHVEEMASQVHHVVGTLSQGRHLDAYNIEPVVKVLAESARRDLERQIPVGCGHDADVDTAGASAAHHTELLFLDEA